MRVVTEICSELGYGVIDGVGEHTEYLRDGVRPESQDKDILLGLELESGKVVEKGVPLQSQDGDISSESESESGKVVRKGVPLHNLPSFRIGKGLFHCCKAEFLRAGDICCIGFITG